MIWVVSPILGHGYLVSQVGDRYPWVLQGDGPGNRLAWSGRHGPDSTLNLVDLVCHFQSGVAKFDPEEAMESKSRDVSFSWVREEDLL